MEKLISLMDEKMSLLFLIKLTVLHLSVIYC